MVPDSDKDDGDDEDESRDRVDFGSDAAAETPQISRGSVLSLPIRKKVTAISSMESVKINRPAAIRESLRLGRVTSQKVRHGVAPRSSEASS